MIPNPIRKVLSTLTTNQVRHLLMGGQACVLYGAAEFSRDTDVAVLADSANLERLAAALAELQARCIAVPPFSEDHLKRGHAVHFRCQHPEAAGIRVDVMSFMRGVAPFPELWARRTTFEMEGGLVIELLSLQDLVQAKKTQRDKDWPMIRRLVEAHYDKNRDHATPKQVQFWLQEARTVTLLEEIARQYPDQLSLTLAGRPLLSLAARGETEELVAALEAEEKEARAADRAYWAPLRQELESLRHQKRNP